MSSGVATKPTLSLADAFSKSCSCSSLVAPCLSHSSVFTNPGTTVFTRILFSTNSEANPFVKLSKPPFKAPPIAAPFPGLYAAPPEVRVSDPPFLTISCFASAMCVNDMHQRLWAEIQPLAVTIDPQNLTPNRNFASSKLASARGPRMILSTPEKTTWSKGASDRSTFVNASSLRTFPTTPFTLGLASRFVAASIFSWDDDTIITFAAASSRAFAAPNPMLKWELVFYEMS